MYSFHSLGLHGISSSFYCVSSVSSVLLLVCVGILRVDFAVDHDDDGEGDGHAPGPRPAGKTVLIVWSWNSQSVNKPEHPVLVVVVLVWELHDLRPSGVGVGHGAALGTKEGGCKE